MSLLQYKVLIFLLIVYLRMLCSLKTENIARATGTGKEM